MSRLLIVLTLALFSSCKDYSTFNRDYTRIAAGPGPEDMALDTINEAKRLIISCSERRTEDYSKNGFYQYEIESGSLSRLELVGFPEDISLRPHGVDIGLVDGKKLLYVVNHEKNKADFPPKGRQSILVFEIRSDSLVFQSQLTDEILISPNDVCADHKGGLYVSNDSGEQNNFFEKLFELKRSTIIHFDGSNWKFVGDKMKYANGVGVKDGRLYVTGTQEKTILSYKINEDMSVSDLVRITSLKGNDNITFSGNKLVTTAHLDFLKFIKHVKDENKLSPCAVYTIDLQSNQLDTLYLDNGAILSAASTGLIYMDQLYVAQVFNPFILEIPLSK